MSRTSRKSAAAGAWIRPPVPAADLRVGLLGGSFNPAHEGHLHVSEVALRALRLDQVWWLVSPQNPLKPAKGMAKLDVRLKTARALARDPRILITDIERPLGTRYTVDTLVKLKRRFPATHFVWLMGSDNLIQIPRWRDWKTIFALVPVAVVARPGTAVKALSGVAAQRFAAARRAPSAGLALARPPAWTFIEARRSPASATALRAQP
jgi:nicotinate-nucleotide adenylyltransferase